MEYLEFVKIQRKIIRDLNMSSSIMSRNYLDIIFFIYHKGYSSVSELARELLFTNYSQTFQIIKKMERLGYLLYFKNSLKGKANFVFLSDKGNTIIAKANTLIM